MLCQARKSDGSYCNNLANRPIVEHLRLLAKQTKTKLGNNEVMGAVDQAISEALAGQATEFAFGDVQPTAVFGCVNEVEAFHIRAGLFGRKRFVEGSDRMRVEVVADQCDHLAFGIARVQ